MKIKGLLLFSLIVLGGYFTACIMMSLVRLNLFTHRHQAKRLLLNITVRLYDKRSN